MNETIEADEYGTNFDGLSERFSRHIYGTVKGRLRLELLREDLASPHLAHLHSAPVKVLDAGCGPAHLSLDWARVGHRVTLVELSQKMLLLAQRNFAAASVHVASARFYQGALQEVLPSLPDSFDLILLHAVLEWTPDPERLLRQVVTKLSPQGVLSVTFYNLDGFLYRRLLQGNFRHLDAPRPRPHLGDLTPIYPLRSAEVEQWLALSKLQVVHKRGLRCFVDFMHPQAASVTYEQILEQEKRFSLQEPFRSVARYMHLLAVKI